MIIFLIYRIYKSTIPIQYGICKTLLRKIGNVIQSVFENCDKN